MSYGFYLIHRSFWYDPLFKQEKFSEREAWHWMIAQASFEPHKVRYRNSILEVKRGQVPTSYRKLKEVFGWSNDRIKSFLGLLEDDGKITKQTGTGFLIITICNYERFQDALRNTGTQTGTVTGTQTGTVTGTHIGANITKGKLKDNERKERGTTSVAPSDAHDNLFLDEGEGASEAVTSSPAPSEPEAPKPKETTNRNRGTRLPPDWVLQEAEGYWAVAEGMSVEQVLSEEKKFRDYWHSRAGPQAVKLDWNATWRNWIRRSLEGMK